MHRVVLKPCPGMVGSQEYGYSMALFMSLGPELTVTLPLVSQTNELTYEVGLVTEVMMAICIS